MRPQDPPPTRTDLDRWTAACFALLAWLAGVIARIGAPRKSKTLRRAVARAERFVAMLLFLRAAARVPPPSARARRPANAAPGFRRTRRDSRLFFRYARIARPRAGLPARLQRLAAVLAAPARAIARFEMLLARGLRAGALVALAPAPAVWRCAPRPAPAFPDSS